MNAISIIGGILGILTVVSGFAIALYKIIKRFENLEESSKLRKEESKILIKANLAIMEGLIQLQCNGPVTHCRDELKEYICERGD